MFYLTQSVLNISSEEIEKKELVFLWKSSISSIFPVIWLHLFYLLLKACPLPKGWTVLLHIFCPLSEVTGWMLRSLSSVHSSGVTMIDQRGLEQAFHHCTQNS